MKLLFVFLIALIATGGFAQEELTQKTETGDLKGTLLLPKKKKNVPVVLIINGSGPTDRDGNQPVGKNNAIKYLAEALQKKNIATLRIDKRGIAGSAEAGLDEKDLRFDHLVDDAKGWISLLAKDKRFSKIVVAGHSQGALVSMLAAIDNPKVKGYISIAGPGEPIDKTIEKQLAKQPPLVKDMAMPILEEMRKGNVVEDVPQMMNSLFRPEIQPYMISWMKYNPSTEIVKIKVPTLIVQGSTDVQVTVEDAEALATAKSDATKVVVENMNHVLKEIDSTDMAKQMQTYGDPDLPIHGQIAPAIVKFVCQK